MNRGLVGLVTILHLSCLACGFEADQRREWLRSVQKPTGIRGADAAPDICIPDCSGVECGDDGCGGSCGLCDLPEACYVEGYCVPQSACLETCAHKQCGGDDCGGGAGLVRTARCATRKASASNKCRLSYFTNSLICLTTSASFSTFNRARVRSPSNSVWARCKRR